MQQQVSVSLFVFATLAEFGELCTVLSVSYPLKNRKQRLLGGAPISTFIFQHRVADGYSFLRAEL
jgi:hypothetical protein